MVPIVSTMLEKSTAGVQGAYAALPKPATRERLSPPGSRGRERSGCRRIAGGRRRRGVSSSRSHHGRFRAAGLLAALRARRVVIRQRIRSVMKRHGREGGEGFKDCVTAWQYAQLL